jgi:hypothetical protein
VVSDDLLPADERQAIRSAIAAWGRAEWPLVRELLEPLVRGASQLADPIEQERVLRHLADATLLDGGLPLETRNRLAREYVERLLDEDPAWTPPPDDHGPDLYILAEDLKTLREARDNVACKAELVTCRASAATTATDLENLQAEHAQTLDDLENSTIKVSREVARNRAVALVPAGVGHFYNGDKVLGAVFLSSELAFAGTGLGLLLWRTFVANCERTAGFRRGSLVCDPEYRDQVGVARQAEEVFGWLTVGSVALDIILAQVRFKSTTRTEVREYTPAEYEQEFGTAAPDAGPARRRTKEDEQPSARLRWRPSAGPIRGGASFGVRLRF